MSFGRCLSAGMLCLACAAVADDSVKIESPDPYGRFSVTGGASFRGRYQENAKGQATHRRGQYKANIDATINLTEDGCLKVSGQIATGDEYDTNWDNTGLGDAEGEINLNLRRLYLDFACYSRRLGIQAGALPVLSPEGLGVDEDGWADGVRASIVLNAKHEVILVLTAADVDQYDVPNVFHRDFDGVNYKQINISARVSERIMVMADFTHHDGNDYARALLELAVSDIVDFMDTFTVESLLQNGEQRGMRFEAGKKLGAWTVKIGHTNLKSAPLAQNSLNLPIEDFYGEGRNYQLYLTRPINERVAMRLRFRDGDVGKPYEVRFDYKF